MEVDEDILKHEQSPFDSNDLNFESKSRIYSTLVSNKTIQNNLNVTDLIKLITEFAASVIRRCADNGCNKKWELKFDENGALIHCDDYWRESDDEVFCHGCRSTLMLHSNECCSDEEEEESNNHNRNGPSSKGYKSSNHGNERRSRSRSRSRERGKRKNHCMIISSDFNNGDNPPSRLSNPEREMVVRPAVGPDLTSKRIQNWSRTCPESRRMCNGLNIEFEWGRHRVIGQIGACYNMRLGEDYEKAYCPAIDKHCPNLNAIRGFWFTRCDVKIRGVLTDGTPIRFRESYGRKACFYKPRNDYGYIKITVTIIYIKR